MQIMSSISNFEREKPKKTYQSIQALSNYIDSNKELDKKELQKLVENVRLNFLSGS
tara:strand:+ start:1317 stop:1484 length:168 start_codon:yes stop_codon:yes gene_type:complete